MCELEVGQWKGERERERERERVGVRDYAIDVRERK